MKHKCNCGDTACKNEFYISSDPESDRVEMSVYGANGHNLFYLDKKDLLNLALDCVNASYNISTGPSGARSMIWNLIRELQVYVEIPASEISLDYRNRLSNEIEAAFQLKEKGEL